MTNVSNVLSGQIEHYQEIIACLEILQIIDYAPVIDKLISCH